MCRAEEGGGSSSSGRNAQGTARLSTLLQTVSAFGSLAEDHGRGDLLTISLFVVDTDHGPERELRPPRHVLRNQELHPVVQPHPLAPHVHDPALDLAIVPSAQWLRVAAGR